MIGHAEGEIDDQGEGAKFKSGPGNEARAPSLSSAEACAGADWASMGLIIKGAPHVSHVSGNKTWSHSILELIRKA